MIIIVKSTASSIERRMLIRRTYGSLQMLNKHRFFTLFVVGRSFNKETQVKIQRESEENEDILQVDADDTYKGLPAKVLACYQWIYYELGDVSAFYATTDDDCMINETASLKNTVAILQIKPLQLYLSISIYLYKYLSLVCIFNLYAYNSQQKHFYRNKTSKYYVPHHVYPSKTYPQFCHGGMTVMPFTLLSDIYQMSEITNRTGMVLEDVFINGILRYKLGRGNSNIIPMSKSYFGPMIWHLGQSNADELRFKFTWTAVTSLLTIRV
uniref:Hexosyltransferase n=1 Tax=Ciona intestinalis TaxID=7719 RepID=F7B2T8_CIOIN